MNNSQAMSLRANPSFRPPWPKPWRLKSAKPAFRNPVEPHMTVAIGNNAFLTISPYTSKSPAWQARHFPVNKEIR
jgi:hypothetical protein